MAKEVIMAKKGTYQVDLGKFKQLRGQLYDVETRALDGQIDLDQAPQLLQVVLTDQFDSINFVDPFAQYVTLLPSLEEQLKLIHRYSEELWEHPLTDDMFASVDMIDHVQSVRDFMMPVVKFGTGKELFEAGALVIKENVPNFWRGDSLKADYEIRPLAGSTIEYKAGIHLVHINLMAYWDPESSRSVDDVRAQAKTTGDKLGYIEPLQAYGLAPKLLQKMDGTNFPYSDMAGYETKSSGGGDWRYSPYLYWNADDSEAYLNAYSVDSRYRTFAAPVVRES